MILTNPHPFCISRTRWRPSWIISSTSLLKPSSTRWTPKTWPSALAQSSCVPQSHQHPPIWKLPPISRGISKSCDICLISGQKIEVCCLKTIAVCLFLKDFNLPVLHVSVFLIQKVAYFFIKLAWFYMIFCILFCNFNLCVGFKFSYQYGTCWLWVFCNVML